MKLNLDNENFDFAAQMRAARNFRFCKGNSSSNSPQTANNNQTATSGSGTTLGPRLTTIGGDKSNLSKSTIATGGAATSVTGAVKGNLSVVNNIQSEDADVIATALGNYNAQGQGAASLIGNIVTAFTGAIQHVAQPLTQPETIYQPATVSGGNVGTDTSTNAAPGGFTREDWLLIAGIVATVAVGGYFALKGGSR